MGIFNPPSSGGGGGGGVTSVNAKTGAVVLNASDVGAVSSVTGTSPIASSGGATPAISIANAAADGATKGAAAFNASDFNATAGVVSIDYTNGQSASTSTKGFLTSTDWTTFNNKQATITTGSVDNSVLRADAINGTTLKNSDILIDDATTTTQNNVAIVNKHQGQTDSSIVITPRGTGAFILGQKPGSIGPIGEFSIGGNPRGSHAVDLQLTRGLAEQVASGIQSVCLGANNASTVDYAVAIGSDNTSSGYAAIGIGTNNDSGGEGSITIGDLNTTINNGSVCIGASCYSDGGYAVALGNETNSSGNYSTSIGYRSSASRYGQVAFASGRFALSGDAQNSRFILRGQSTSTTARNLTPTGANSSNFLGIPVGKVMAMTINIAGISTLGDVAHYVRQYAVRNILGTSSQVYSPVTIGSDNPSGTSIALSVNDPDDTLRIVVTGTSVVIWRWVATIDAVEIAY